MDIHNWMIYFFALCLDSIELASHWWCPIKTFSHLPPMSCKFSLKSVKIVSASVFLRLLKVTNLSTVRSSPIGVYQKTTENCSWWVMSDVSSAITETDWSLTSLIICLKMTFLVACSIQFCIRLQGYVEFFATFLWYDLKNGSYLKSKPTVS